MKDKENEGALFKNDDDWSIIQQGNLNIDGEKNRIIGVKRLNKEGKQIVEVYLAIGTLKANENKISDKSPDAKGVINKISFGDSKSISAWKEVSQNGNPYTKLAVRDFRDDFTNNDDSQDEKNDEQQMNANNNDMDDEIPF